MNVFPIFPKRHLVSPRNWFQEPEDRQTVRNVYRNRMYGNINPWITAQLRNDEKFNVTIRDIRD
jgi:hypothetical protein